MRFKNIILTLILLFIFILPVKANSIKSIDMDIYLDSDGTAHIKEVWKASLTQGTEGYKPYSDLGISKVTNFSVTDDLGNTYETLDKWNTSASFSSKANKCGINKTYDGLELCFGISKYGDRTYTLTYNITDFVTQYTDVQGIYFTFIDMEQHIDKAKVTIYSDTPFSIEENVKIWGYGHVGTTTIEDGKIVIETTEPMNLSNYISGLIRFETNMFNTNKISDISFDDIFDEAMEEAEEYENDHAPIYYILAVPVLILLSLLYIFLNPFTWFIILIIYIAFKGKGLPSSSGSLVYDGGQNLGSVEAFRDIPCNKDLFYAYFLAYQYNIVSSKSVKEGIIGAVLLKWVDENKIDVIDGKKRLFNVKDNNYAVDFNHMASPTDELEKGIYDIFISAAGINKVLEAKEFEKWCTKNYYKLSKWFDKIIEHEKSTLEAKGLITLETKEVKGLFGRTSTRTVKHLTIKAKEEAIKLAGLKKFLEEYSSIEEKKYIEVHVWNEYLILAELLGIADKVREQFSKLYPDIKTNPTYNIDNMRFITNMASCAYKGYTVGINRASARSYSGGHSYSGGSSWSGGGGHSFSSGGHSSSGSHGGGFR